MKTIFACTGEKIWVDAADCDWLNSFRWHLSHGYAETKINGKNVLMHHLILRPPEGQVIDHVNQVKTDNRKANLRIASYSQNVINKSRTNRASSYRGVFPMKSSGKWFVRISYQKQHFMIGIYADPAFAAKVYDVAALHFHGEFAVFNFPDAQLNPQAVAEFERYLEGRAQKTRAGVSQFRGVARSGEKWQVGIGLNGKRKALGRFDDEEAAARALISTSSIMALIAAPISPEVTIRLRREQMPVDRLMIKHKALLARAGVYYCRCDLCRVLLSTLGQSGEMHEIFRRSLTQKGGAARDASYAVELVSILCRACHEQQSANPDANRDKLIRINFQLFGHSRVKAAYDRLQAILAPKGLTLPYQLPSPADEEGNPDQPRPPPNASRWNSLTSFT